MGKPDEAIADFNKGLELDPDNDQVRQELARLGVTLAPKKPPAPVASKSAAPIATYRGGDPDRDCSRADGTLGISACTALVKREPDNLAGYHNRGVDYAKMGEFDLAIADFTKAIALHPTPPTYVARADAYQKIKDSDRAIADYTKAIALEPRNATLYYDRANVFALDLKFDPAIADYTKAIALKPGFLYAYVNRGFIYATTGKRDQAIADFKKALEIDPNEARSKDALKHFGVAN